MKKIFLILSTFFFMFNSAFAIDWVNIKSENGNLVGLDKDSIKEYQGYYFYNVKMYTNGLDDIVVTMQCRITHPFCARLKHYKSTQYEELKGNYDNITNEMTKNLEPVTYKSRAYAAYKNVKEIKRNKPEIVF